MPDADMSIASMEQASSVQQILQRVQELYADVRSKLSNQDLVDQQHRSAISELVTLALKVKGRDDLDQKSADTLDEIGVGLWNASITLRQLREDGRAFDGLVADLRLAAVSLLDASLLPDSDVDVILRVAQAYCGLLSLRCCTHKDGIDSILSRAKEIVAMLPKPEDEEPSSKLVEQLRDVQTAFACAQFDISYAAGWFSEASEQLDHLLDELPPASVSFSKAEPVWRRCLRLGEHYLLKLPELIAQNTSDGKEPPLDAQTAQDCRQAIKWLQKGITLQERAGIHGVVVVKTLLQLAYVCYVMASQDDSAHSALTAATAALNEAAKMVQSDGTKSNGLVEHIALMRFKITSRRGTDTELCSALDQLCASVAFTDTTTNRLLSLVESGPKRLLAVGIRTVIGAMVKSEQDGIEKHLGSVVLRAVCLLVDSSTLIQIDELLDDVMSSKLSLSQDVVCAAQMIIWRRGDAAYRKGDYGAAADIHMLAAHQAFAAMPDNVAKSVRRVAVCYLALHQPQSVRACLDLCPSPYDNMASTHLCKFLAAVQLNDEDSALQTFQALMQAPDLDPQALVEAVEEAQRAHMDKVVHAGLDRLLAALRADAELQNIVDVLVLHRTLISIFLPPDKEDTWTETAATNLNVYLRHALDILKARMSTDTEGRTHADWLWKHAFNAAITASRTMPARLTAAIFEVAYELMEERNRFDGDPPDTEMTVARWCAKFAYIEVAVSALPSAESDAERQELSATLQREIATAETLRKAAHGLNPEAAPREAEWSLMLMSLKIALASRDYALVRSILTDLDARLASVPFKLIEAIAYAVSVGSEIQVPVDAEAHALEALLKRYIIDEGDKSIPRALRYYRFVLLCLMEDESFARTELRAKALHYLSEVRDLLVAAEAQGERDVPVDDVIWFMAQAWQKSMELSIMDRLEDARALSELGLALSRLIPFPEATRQNMEAQHQSLLHRCQAEAVQPQLPPFPRQGD